MSVRYKQTATIKTKLIIFIIIVALLIVGFSKYNVSHKNSTLPQTSTVANAGNEQENDSQEEDINNCPVEGSAVSPKLQELNRHKNRTKFPIDSDFNSNVTLTALLASGDDRDRWNIESAAKITGYVRDVKPGGVETVNCKAKDISQRDTHIELVLNPMSYEKNEAVIVEITPRLRKIMGDRGEDWSTGMIRSKYLGRWVTVEGWLLFDVEHANMSENTHPGNPKNWRATAWEIHPVTSITIAETH